MTTHLRTAASRRFILGLLAAAPAIRISLAQAHDLAAPTSASREKFAFLSENGNSSCSRSFLESIKTMPPTQRLQGSCCGPMVWTRYAEQIDGLKSYASIPEIPPDPYDIEVGLARRLLTAYELELAPEHQTIYDAAFAKSKEGGPCCCRCWRWHVLGGMAKVLIRERRYDATQVGALWDLESGCGGDHEH